MSNIDLKKKLKTQNDYTMSYQFLDQNRNILYENIKKFYTVL